MLHAEPFETHLLSSELCVLFIYFLKGNCIGLEYHIILSKIHIIVIIKTKIIDKNKSCSNIRYHFISFAYASFASLTNCIACVCHLCSTGFNQETLISASNNQLGFCSP